jgi:hypothetical protein
VHIVRALFGDILHLNWKPDDVEVADRIERALFGGILLLNYEAFSVVLEAFAVDISLEVGLVVS